ncbi:zinc finger protein Pegasus isoform X2 [Paramormyrops kingsleyae]|uniref:zinc finger protein Pegasus isoform X2 n=1 Tax=Paramormyrops kingsleyae TaxID=1676925 RepID=UPI000CD5F056|nr:zinc finger protein Pegasus isoform X2 [Paramormyrops kingsleyae]
MIHFIAILASFPICWTSSQRMLCCPSGVRSGIYHRHRMGEKKPEPLDFVKDFQEYLTQQTQHVNMISGSVSGDKEPEPLQGGLHTNPVGMQSEDGDGGDSASVEYRPMFCLPAAGTENDQNGLDHPSVEVSLEDSSGMLVDGFERTYDGKLKCRYCNYASKGTARLIEHIRIHTGEKPHRCHLCPFASAYERHLEAHMRSHTGEKPYKCELCSFRCSDRSNLSHHRRRRHKLLPMKGARSGLSNKKMLSVLQKKASGLSYSRRLLINFSPPSMVVQKPDYLNDFSHELPHLHPEAYEGVAKAHIGAGQLASLPPEAQAPVSPDGLSCRDEKPFLIQQPSAGAAPVAVPASVAAARAASPTTPEPRPPAHRNYSPVAGPSSEHSARTSTPSVSNSQPSTPAPNLPAQDPQLLHSCQHCDTYFADNILYTIHMGCHGYENPFQCNICGCKCKNKYDFACHFARGQHKQ